MITPNDFVRQWQDEKLALLSPNIAIQWGSYEFIKYSMDSVNQLSITETSKMFLLEAGLPKRAWRCLRFDTPYKVFAPMTEIQREWPDEYRRYRLLAAIGFSSDGKFIVVEYLCLDDQTDGKVVIVRKENVFLITFCNSSVVQLAQYLLVLRQYLEWQLENCSFDDDERSRQTQKALEVGDCLREIDPQAAANKEHWGRVIDEIEGLTI